MQRIESAIAIAARKDVQSAVGGDPAAVKFVSMGAGDGEGVESAVARVRRKLVLAGAHLY